MAVNGQPAKSLTIAGGGVGWIQVSMSAAPPSPVSASVQLSQLGLISVIPATVVFDATNYSVPQTLTVTAPKNDSTSDLFIDLHLTASGYADGVVSITVKSPNVQALLVTPNMLTITQGKTGMFTVRPAFAPSGNMTVNVTSANTAAATVSPSTLSFTAANYKMAQPVTVTGSPTLSGTQDASVNITLDSQGLPSTPVAVTVVNTNVQNILMDTSSLALVQGGAPGTVGVTLAQSPPSNAPVTVNVASSDATVAKAAPATLTFTAANYATAQSVTVTPLTTKTTVDGSCKVALTATGLTERDVTVSVKNNNVQAIVLSATNVSVNVGGASTFTVALAFDPGATPLTVSLLSSNTAAVTVSASTLTFSTTNYSAPQTVTVTGVPTTSLGNQTVSIPLTAPGVATQTVTVKTINSNTQSIVLNPTSASFLETATATVTAQLAFAPSTSTTVAVASSNTTAVTVSPATLTFSAANYNTPQTVTLTGVKGTGNTNRSANATFSSTGVPTATLPITILTSATPAFLVTPNTLTLSDTGSPGTFTVALSMAPTANTTVTVASSNTAAATASPATLTFTAANYATPQTVTVTPTPGDTKVSDTSTISVSAAGITTQNVSVTVTNIQAIVASSTTVTVATGGTATFTVKLAYAPASTVAVSVTSGSPGAVTASPGSLSFTSANYSTRQTVTLTGLSDGATANETASITLALTGAPNVVVTATKTPAAAPTCDSAAALPNPSTGQHNAGRACLTCHSAAGGATTFTIGGTLFSAATGGTAVAQATIHLVDGANNDVKLSTATNGNFWTTQAVTFPLKVRASLCPNTDQSMQSQITSGDCNSSSCHTSTFQVHLP
jgi:hypothetical protein